MYGLSRRIWQKLITPTKPFEAGTTRYLTEAFHQIGVAADGQLQKSKQSNAKQQSINEKKGKWSDDFIHQCFMFE